MIDTYDYISGIVYKNDAIEFLPMPEGRVINLNNAFVYEYQYKDHLGNLRVSFREANQVQYVASSELSNANTERTQFANVDLTRQDKPLFAGQKACRTNTTQPLGLWKSMPITKGDKVKVNAQAFYQGTASNTSINWNAFFYVNPNYGSGIINGENITNPNNVLNMFGVGIIPTFSGNTTSVPKSYLVAYFFDKSNVSYKQIIRYVSVNYQNTWLSLPEIDEEVLQNGRVEIFVANESNINVFFDNLTITHLPTLISQENHYYAFGMNAKEIEKEGSNRFQFMGVEKESSFGLDWTETDHRSYDSEVGRFWQVDNKSEKYSMISEYNYSLNNPINLTDPSGEDAIRDTDERGNRRIRSTIYFNFRNSMNNTQKLDYIRNFAQSVLNSWGSALENSGITLSLTLDFTEHGKTADNLERGENLLDVDNLGDVPSSINDNIFNNTGTMNSKENGRDAGHEFGHMLGVSDRYLEAFGVVRGYDSNSLVAPLKASSRRTFPLDRESIPEDIQYNPANNLYSMGKNITPYQIGIAWSGQKERRYSANYKGIYRGTADQNIGLINVDSKSKIISAYNFHGHIIGDFAWVRRVNGGQIYNNPATKLLFEPNNNKTTKNNNNIIK